jgi:hypothetical protein
MDLLKDSNGENVSVVFGKIFDTFEYFKEDFCHYFLLLPDILVFYKSFIVCIGFVCLDTTSMDNIIGHILTYR